MEKETISFKKENDIYYLYDYYPKNKFKQDLTSINVLKYKNDDPSQIETFTKDLILALLSIAKGDKDKLKGRVICIMPSSTPNKVSLALKTSAQEIANFFNMEFVDNLFVRYKPHVENKRSTNYQERSIDSHLKTMKVREDIDLKGKKVIVLDDIATTGNSLLSCKILLKRESVESVGLIVIAKTVSVFEYNKASGSTVEELRREYYEEKKKLRILIEDFQNVKEPTLVRC